ncbi:MAG: alpha/beta hydrolase [Burkholderiales bacterium PBB4]|nr:MAG: alpha/beta hydrolase [Burkholderiales bacterium PBB4]
MKLLPRLLWVGLVAVLVFVLAGVLATWAPDRKVQELSSRWAPAPSAFLAVGGMQVHYRDEGPRDDAVPLILLHGTSASLQTWDGWVEALKPRRRVIRLDLPAFGLTGPHPANDYSIESYVQVVAAFASALGVEKFALAGNSLGGQIAWATAVQFPKRVQRLVLVDAAGYPMQPQSIPIGFQLARMPGVRLLMEWVLPRGVIQSSVRNVYGDPDRVTAALVDRYYELTLREGNRRALGYRVEQMQKANLAQDAAAIKTLKLPTLIIWGGKDRLIPVENAHRFAADIVGSRLLVLESLGHVPHEEDAATTVREVDRFLDAAQ